MSAPITDEQRARLQRAVDSACEELDLLTRATIVVALHRHRQRQRAKRVLAVLAVLGGLGLVALVLWAIGRLAAWGGAS